VQIPLDYHMHSVFSEDGDDSLEAMCLRAISAGIPEIGFSEHWDVGPYEANPRYFKAEPWFDRVKHLRTEFDGKLSIKAGVEIAEPHLYDTEMNELLQKADFDYTIGSVHYVGKHFMFNEKYFVDSTADKVYISYFQELKCMVEKAAVDIVGHFDVPARTGKPIFGYEPARYEESIRSVLEVCIKRGLTLDINTAGLRKPAKIIMPDPLILNWYVEMGGKNVTLGSDAHRISEVGLHLDEAIHALKNVGIHQVMQFEKRHSHPIPI
jgi:histidinol-phosphatase (PHP family)